MSPLTCMTPDGPGRVVEIKNATRWLPAFLLVELEDGRRRLYNAARVTVTR